MNYMIQRFVLKKDLVEFEPVRCPDGWEPFYVQYIEATDNTGAIWYLWAKREIEDEDDGRVSGN